MEIARIAEVAEIIAAELRPRQRVWIVGVARLTDLEDLGKVTSDDALRLVEDARELGFYPLGRAAYLPESLTPAVVPEEYAAAGLETSQGEHYDYRGVIGLGTCRDLAVAESYRLQVDDRDGVLLSDVEAMVADLLTLAYVRAMHVDYRGRIDMLVTLADDGVSHDPGLWRVDEASGAELPTGRHTSDFGTITFSTAASAPFEELYAVVRAASGEAAACFGLNGPQLIADVDSADVAQEIDGRCRVLREHDLLALHERD